MEEGVDGGGGGGNNLTMLTRVLINDRWRTPRSWLSLSEINVSSGTSVKPEKRPT